MLKHCFWITMVSVTIKIIVNLWSTFRDIDVFSNNIDPDLNFDLPGLIRSHGYPFENHTVITDDGYILQLHRIPYSPSTPSNMSIQRRPILIQHGIFVSSAVWVIEGPTRALAYKLADAGWDVWLGNNRGNIFSRRHRRYDANRQPGAFYNYSWHEIGLYDLPACLDYIANVTGHTRVDYAGHSQGSIALFALLSVRPAYNAKIRVIVALAPTVYMRHAWTPTVVLGRIFYEQIKWFLEMVEWHNLLPGNMFGGDLATRMLCADNSFLQPLCKMCYYWLSGYNPEQLNSTLLPLWFTHTPVGASTKQALHYLQISISDDFHYYDYGKESNLKIYSQTTPPKYNLSNIVAPIMLFYSANDFYSSIEDTQRLASALPNVIKFMRVADARFTHFNFMTSKNVGTVLNSKIVKALLDLQFD